MFTGIIQSTGTVKAITAIGGDKRLTITAPHLGFDDVAIGDSIASNGICLTVVHLDGMDYVADVSRETIHKTALASWQVGDIVNLEKAMLPTTRFGGHIVAGHVDGVGTIKKISKNARALQVEIQLPCDLMKYTADKGSITADGISLTTNAIYSDDCVVCLTIIPHTARMTNIDKHWRVGGLVNIEVDLLARYLERLLLCQRGSLAAPVTKEWLLRCGFG